MRGPWNPRVRLLRVGVCLALVLLGGCLESFWAALLVQGPWSPRVELPLHFWYCPGGASELFQVAPLERGPTTPRTIRFHKTILHRYGDHAGSASSHQMSLSRQGPGWGSSGAVSV